MGDDTQASRVQYEAAQGSGTGHCHQQHVKQRRHRGVGGLYKVGAGAGKVIALSNQCCPEHAAIDRSAWAGSFATCHATECTLRSVDPQCSCIPSAVALLVTVPTLRNRTVAGTSPNSRNWILTSSERQLRHTSGSGKRTCQWARAACTSGRHFAWSMSAVQFIPALDAVGGAS